MTNNQDEDGKVVTFRVPRDLVNYHGTYSVEVFPGTEMRCIRPPASIDGNIITVKDGYLREGANGFDFLYDLTRFIWKHDRIKAIRDGEGRPIWANDRYR